MSGIPKKPSVVAEKASMSSAASWRTCIEVLAGEPNWSDTRESMLSRAAREADVPFRSAKALYYAETTDPKYSIGSKVIRAATKQADRFAAIADSLEAKDHDFYRAEIDRYRTLAKRVRGPAG